MKWRVVVTSEGRCYLVHVNGETETEARREAKMKVLRDYRDIIELRVRSAERIAI